MSPVPTNKNQDNRKIMKSAMNSYNFNEKSQEKGFLEQNNNSLKNHLMLLKKPHIRQKSQMEMMSSDSKSIKRENFDKKIDEVSSN